MDNGNLAPAFILIRESKNGGQFRSEEREEKVCWFYESKKPLHLPHSVVLGHLISVHLSHSVTLGQNRLAPCLFSEIVCGMRMCRVSELNSNRSENFHVRGRQISKQGQYSNRSETQIGLSFLM